MVRVRFPIIGNKSYDKRQAAPHPMTISWSVAELAYSVYAARYGDAQSLERMAERGGFHAVEMDDLLPDWREREGDGRTADLEELRELVNDWMERPPAERLSPTLQELFDNAVRPLLRRTER